MDEDRKTVNQEVNDLKTPKQDVSEKEGNSLLIFFIGVILLGVGTFMFTNQVSVSSSWYSWGFLRFGAYNFSNGLVVMPLIIGIIWMFFNSKSIIAKVITTLGAIFIIITIIMSINIRFERTSLYVYLMIIGMMAAGSGLILRVLFKKR